MGNILRIDAFSGASGDMFLAALTELAGEQDNLSSLPALLGLVGKAVINMKSVNRNGIYCLSVTVLVTEENPRSRNLNEIAEIYEKSGLTKNARRIAQVIIAIVAEAESKIHGISIDKVHFHEVGAIDSIIDIAGAAWLLDKLKIDETYSSVLVTGSGFVKTQHGQLPVPAPATLEILRGMPHVTGDEKVELMTPTGAAIIKYLEPIFYENPLADFQIAYGAGKKDLVLPNVLRLALTKAIMKVKSFTVIETNLDDTSAEFLGSTFQDELLKTGAVDFYITQVTMKKGRPGLVLTVMCDPENLEHVSSFILNRTTAIGLRWYTSQKLELERRIESIHTDLGKFTLKISITPAGEERVKPEADEVLECSRSTGLDPATITGRILSAWYKSL